MNVAPPPAEFRQCWTQSTLSAINWHIKTFQSCFFFLLLFFWTNILSGSDLKTLYFPILVFCHRQQKTSSCAVWFSNPKDSQAGQTFVVMATFRMCVHVRFFECVCVHLLYSWRMTGTVVCCHLMYDAIHTRTHTHAGQSTKQKALWERLGWHICVCVCLRMETVNMKCVCVCTLGRRGSPWHSRNKIRPSNTLNYKTSLWKKRKNVFNFH